MQDKVVHIGKSDRLPWNTQGRARISRLIPVIDSPKTGPLLRGPHPPSRLFFATCAGVLLLATTIRVLGMFNDLWLDEIWSLQLAGSISSWWQVFTTIHHDNNHYLNTCWLHLCGQRGSWYGYRIPSVVAGVGTVLMAGVIGQRRSRICALIAMTVTSFSYVLVLYSSEARGYSEVVFFSYISFYLLDTFLGRLKWPLALLFSLTSLLGFCSHLTFIDFFAAAFVWSICRLRAKGMSGLQTLFALLECFSLPSLFLAWIYVVDVRPMVIGGGNPIRLGPAYENALAWAIGAPLDEAMIFWLFLGAVLVFGAGIRLLWREKSDLVVLFLGVVLITPVGLALVTHSDSLYVRYFIVSIAFFLLLFSFLLDWLWRRGILGKIGFVGILGLFLSLNGLRTAELMKFGRGQYSEAVRYMAGRRSSAETTVGGDHDFRIKLVFEFYKRETGMTNIRYVSRAEWAKEGVQWLVCHRDSCEAPIPPGAGLTDPEGHQFWLVHVFPSAPLSGLHWFVYRNTPSKGSQSSVASPVSVSATWDPLKSAHLDPL